MDDMNPTLPPSLDDVAQVSDLRAQIEDLRHSHNAPRPYHELAARRLGGRP